MTELEKLCRDLLTDLLANNSSAIKQELRENPEGKLSVATGLKLRLVGSKLYATGSLAYSRKFTDEAEGMAEIEDPNQPALPGVSTVTMTIPGKNPVTVPLNTFKTALDIIKDKHAQEQARSVVEAHET